MTDQSCVIVGASHAGCNLAMQLRKEGWPGEIKLLSAEAELPYHRPPLSKEFLAGKKVLDQVRLRPEKMYQSNEIDLQLNTTVTSLDAGEKTVALSDGSKLPFHKLALCTGSIPRQLSLGLASDRVFYIRTAADVRALHAILPQVKKVVVIGGGYIGLESAAVLTQLGKDVSLLEMEERLLQRVSSVQLSDYFANLHAANGVSIDCATVVTSLTNENAGGLRIGCKDGRQYLADLVIAGVGITPDTRLARQAGLEIDNGIKVDDCLRTSAADIYALGDCASHPSQLYQRRIRLESVQNANDQARTAAVNICGGQQVYDALPWFWSDQYNIKLQIAGLSSGYDEVVTRGSVGGDEGFVLFYRQQGSLIAAECVNRPKEFMVSKQLIKDQIMVDPARLQDESVAPADFT